MPVPDYQRKLYAFLQSMHCEQDGPAESLLCGQLQCFKDDLSNLWEWWQAHGQTYQNIGSSSDRVNLHATQPGSDRSCAIRHPISGEPGTVAPLPLMLDVSSIPNGILNENDPKKVFWWFWRFYPEQWLNPQSESLADGLLYPAHRVLPDCPLHSYQATVSALAGAIAPEAAPQHPENTRPYLLIFTFSPVQDFIKASRKFLDFWAGSYMLHYLSAHLCWHIADTHGPDALIVPSLWGQDIIDARLVQHYREVDSSFCEVLECSFKAIGDRKTPVERFTDRSSSSLSTAGFPNVITALVPGLEAAKQLGKDLADALQKEWFKIGKKIRDDIRGKVSQQAKDILDNHWDEFWAEFKAGLPDSESSEPYRSDLRKWCAHTNQHNQLTYPNWEWCPLWDQQLQNTWEPYWAAVPLGDPGQSLTLQKQGNQFDRESDQAWKTAQTTLSKAWQKIPSEAEEHAFDTLNVGTWWGSFQQRLRIAIQSVKNTRVWKIPAAPGERSTISGQYSAVHPNLNYRVVQRRGETQDFREGGGLPEGTMRLFWLMMAKAYPGLFNGSERLNALELTKRMAWQFGGVAVSLGIPLSTTISVELGPDEADVLEIPRQLSDEDYEQIIRFPNLSSIAAARFVHDAIAEARDQVEEDNSSPAISQPRRYWNSLAREIRAAFGSDKRNRFACRTRGRSFQVPKTDQQINPRNRSGQDFNGVMFSAKWLAEDMALDKHSPDGNSDNSDVSKLRRAVEAAHQKAGFGEGSPSDWWAIVLADGDGMGQYISGSKLENYRKYIDQKVVDQTLPGLDELNATQKRMGPATHVGLNRALLDFSNRLVPYLTEKRFCGKVIYSGGDDVMAVLPIEDVPEYLRSLRAAWSGTADPEGEFDHGDGYWRPKPDSNLEGIPNRPLFTMGSTATLSTGVVIAHKSVPLPTVLENLWVAESDRAKEMVGKDGICFRVIYSGGNTLEALMKGEILQRWWECIYDFAAYGEDLSPLLYRLAEELPYRAAITPQDWLFPKAAKVIMGRRDKKLGNFLQLIKLIKTWECWVKRTYYKTWGTAWTHRLDIRFHERRSLPLGTHPDDLGYLLRFTAFWVDKMVQRQSWRQGFEMPTSNEPTAVGRG